MNIKSDIIDEMGSNIKLPDEYIGKDKRSFKEIITTDLNTLKNAKITISQLIQKITDIRNKALENLEEETVITESIVAFADQARGLISCPLCGEVVRKTNIILKNNKTNRNIVISDMNIHLIKAHSFFEGRGSKFRIEPAEILEMIFDT